MDTLFFGEYGQLLFFVLVALWTLPWKGVALWKAAQKGHKVWFIVILVVNSLAILEILYIFALSKRPRAVTPARESAVR